MSRRSSVSTCCTDSDLMQDPAGILYRAPFNDDFLNVLGHYLDDVDQNEMVDFDENNSVDEANYPDAPGNPPYLPQNSDGSLEDSELIDHQAHEQELRQYFRSFTG